MKGHVGEGERCSRVASLMLEEGKEDPQWGYPVEKGA